MITVLYDSECPLCSFQKQMLSWLDWCNQSAFVSLHQLSQTKDSGTIHPNLQKIERADLLEAIHCMGPDGNVHRGARAIRHLSLRIPLLLPLALLLWLPGVIWIAEWVYMRISRNRHLLSRLFGCKGACKLLPERKRDQDKS